MTFEKTLWPGLTIRGGRGLSRHPSAAVSAGAPAGITVIPATCWRDWWRSGRAGPTTQFLQERVFDPLGLTDMGFTVPDDDWHRMAEVYAPGEGGGLVNATARLPNISSFRDGETIFSGGGGLAGTAMDYLRVAQMLLKRGQARRHAPPQDRQPSH